MDDNGIVRLYEDKCDLSVDCIKACPYDARYVDTTKKITDKCIFCADTRLARGETTTACQITCPAKLRYFGDLDDEHSEISQILKTREHFTLKPQEGTKPKLFYLK
jgi:Fe-S-cluster-containing dehydrogenase component